MQHINLTFSWPQAVARKWIRPGASVCLAWGRGTGKSKFLRLIAWLLIAKARLTGKPVRVVLLMPTLQQAKKVHGKATLDEMGGEWRFLGGEVNRTDWRIEFPGGSWVQWVSAERLDNARGIRCDVALIDECDDIDPEAVSAVLVPWFTEPWSLKIKVFVGTPLRGRNGLLYREFKRGQDGEADCFSLRATYKDAPKFCDIAEVEKARRFMTPATFAREYLADFDSAEGIVYPMFSAAFHVREPWPNVEPTEVLIGVDHGYEDPGVFEVAFVYGNGRDAVIWLVDEVYEQHRVESWWLDKARELVAKHPRARWYCDPSQPARVEAIRRLGAKIEKVDNCIEDGVAAVADRMAIRTTEDGREYARFYVSARCRGFLDEVGKYRRKRDPRNAERILDDIQDRDNHAQDSARYLVLSRFGHPAGVRHDRSNYHFG